MNKHNDRKEVVIKALKESVERTGLDRFIVYGVLTGGFIYNQETINDLDILIVLKNNAISNPDVVKKLKNFSIDHVIIQMENGFTPDWNFPTYFVTEQQVDEVLHGRPFIVDKTGHIDLKRYSPKKLLEDQESDYNIILFQLISNNLDLFAGNLSKLEKDVKKALVNIFLYTYQVLNYSSHKFINEETLFRDLFKSAGLNYKITNKLQIFLWEILKSHHFGLLHGQKFFFDHQSIQKYFITFIRSFYTKYKAKHIFKWKDMSRNVKKLILKEKFIEKVYNLIFHAKNHEEEWGHWHDRTNQQIRLITHNNIPAKEISDKEEMRYYKSLHDSVFNLFTQSERSKINNMLEVGSGSGALSLLLSKTFECKSTLIDNSDIAIQYASLVNKKSEMVLGDATKMPFADNTFDFVHSVGLIEHFDDVIIYHILRESKRVLKKGGYFYLAVPNFFSPDLLSIWYRYGKGTERYILPSTLSQYVQQVGFKGIKNGHSEYVSKFFQDYNLLKMEKILGTAGLGFLNYVFCRK